MDTKKIVNELDLDAEEFLNFMEWLMEQRNRDDNIGHLACHVWMTVQPVLRIIQGEYSDAAWRSYLRSCNADNAVYSGLDQARQEYALYSGDFDDD